MFCPGNYFSTVFKRPTRLDLQEPKEQLIMALQRTLLLGFLLVLGCAVTSSGATSSKQCDKASLNRSSFPAGFTFGTASAAYQVPYLCRSRIYVCIYISGQIYGRFFAILSFSVRDLMIRTVVFLISFVIITYSKNHSNRKGNYLVILFSTFSFIVYVGNQIVFDLTDFLQELY